jgi:hypothetical protein
MTSCHYSPLTASALDSEYIEVYDNPLKISDKQKNLHHEFLSHFQKQQEY